MRHKARKKLLDTIREALAGIQIINQKLNGFLNLNPGLRGEKFNQEKRLLRSCRNWQNESGKLALSQSDCIQSESRLLSRSCLLSFPASLRHQVLLCNNLIQNLPQYCKIRFIYL